MDNIKTKNFLTKRKIFFLLSFSVLVMSNMSSALSAGKDYEVDKTAKEFSLQLSKLKGVSKEGADLIFQVALDDKEKRREQSYVFKNEDGNYQIGRAVPLTAFFNHKRGQRNNSYVRFKNGDLEISIGNVIPNEWDATLKKVHEKSDFDRLFRDTWCKGLFGGISFERLPEMYKKHAEEQLLPLIESIKNKEEKSGKLLLVASSPAGDKEHEYYVWSSSPTGSKIGIRYNIGELLTPECLEEINTFGSATPGKKREQNLTPQKGGNVQASQKEGLNLEEEGLLEISEMVNLLSASGKNKEQIVQALNASLKQFCEDLDPEVLDSLLGSLVVNLTLKTRGKSFSSEEKKMSLELPKGLPASNTKGLKKDKSGDKGDGK